MHQAQQEIQLGYNELYKADLFRIARLPKDRLQKHERNRDWCSELVRNRGSVALQVLCMVLLFDHLRLEAQLFHVRGHVLEVHSY